MEHEYMRTHYGEKYWDKLCGKPMPEESTPPIWKENYLLQQQYIEELERELNEATCEIEEKRKDIVWLATEKAKLENYVMRLEEAGDAMERWCSDWVAASNWEKAKEAKL